MKTEITVQHSEYYVTEIDSKGRVVATVSGMGRNKSTLDADAKSRRTAQRWASQCRKDHPCSRFVICGV